MQRALGEYMESWGYPFHNFSNLAEALPIICTHMEHSHESKMCVFLCAKG